MDKRKIPNIDVVSVVLLWKKCWWCCVM